MRAGRPPTEADDRPGAPPVAVVSEPFWRDLNGGEAGDFAPQTLEINTQRFDIVGVVASPFRGMQLGQDVRVSLTRTPSRQSTQAPSRCSRRETRAGSRSSCVSRRARAAHREPAVRRHCGRPADDWTRRADADGNRAGCQRYPGPTRGAHRPGGGAPGRIEPRNQKADRHVIFRMAIQSGSSQ